VFKDWGATAAGFLCQRLAAVLSLLGLWDRDAMLWGIPLTSCAVHSLVLLIAVLAWQMERPGRAASGRLASAVACLVIGASFGLLLLLFAVALLRRPTGCQGRLGVTPGPTRCRWCALPPGPALAASAGPSGGVWFADLPRADVGHGAGLDGAAQDDPHCQNRITSIADLSAALCKVPCWRGW
jgi:hypothetical protein